MRKTVFFALLTTVVIASQAILATSCADSNAGSTETTPPSPDTAGTGAAAETETTYLDTLPVKDFEGAEFCIVGQSTNSRQNFYIEELEGDLINTALHDRDVAVSERLNITLVYEPVEDRAEVASMVNKVVRAGDEAYHMVINALTQGIQNMIGTNALYNLTDIPHLTLDSDLWTPSLLDTMMFDDNLYFTTGPISPMRYMTPIAMAMNTRLAATYDIGDMYEVVLDGKWTLDLLHSLTKDLANDLDNNGKMDENDFYGLAVDGTFGNVLFNSAGYNPIDASYKITLDSSRSVDAIDRVSSMFGDRSKVFNDRGGAGTSADVFRAGNALFMDYTILGIMSFRDLEDDFAILPTPKYDESQEDYYITNNTWLPSGVAVPSNCSDTERTGLVMETMAAYSKQIIEPAAYEKTLQGKVARDENSSKMLDIIFQNAYFDMVTALNFAETAILVRDCALGEQDNFVSAWTKKQKAAQKELDKIMEVVAES